MIRKISFSNFYSFEGKQDINFLATKKKSYDYYDSSKKQITKIAGFVGGNASGKTNIMRLFSFLAWFIGNQKLEGEYGVRNILPYKTYFHNNKKSSIDVEFEYLDRIYFYSIVLKQSRILKESLTFKRKKKGSKMTQVFLRNNKEDIVLNKEIFKGIPSDLLKRIRPEMSLIAYLESHYTIDEISNVYKYFRMIGTNINEAGGTNLRSHQLAVIKNYLTNHKLKMEMENVVADLDLGLKGFEISEHMNSDSLKTLNVMGIHEVDSDENKLDFKYESKGTQSIFFLLGRMLFALENNGVLIIDEIETGLHPEALNKLLTYFLDKNEKGMAQILFSSHSHTFLNKLDQHQIYIVEKRKKGGSYCQRLCDIDGVRSDENFLAKYMSGVYGGFPKISL